LRRLLGRTSSVMLQQFPALCSDIHVVGIKEQDLHAA
jgi:hypothetical protein